MFAIYSRFADFSFPADVDQTTESVDMKEFTQLPALRDRHESVATARSRKQHAKLLVMIALTLMLAACGGGNERGESSESSENRATATFATTVGTTVPSTTAIANGKALYAQNCFTCHGASIAAAKNSNNTLNAIVSNKGGMGFLTTKITSSQADDIAAYMSFGL